VSDAETRRGHHFRAARRPAGRGGRRRRARHGRQGRPGPAARREDPPERVGAAGAPAQLRQIDGRRVGGDEPVSTQPERGPNVTPTQKGSPWKVDARAGGDGKARELPEQGPQPAVVVALIDLGTDDVTYKDDKTGQENTRPMRKMCIAFELT